VNEKGRGSLKRRAGKKVIIGTAQAEPRLEREKEGFMNHRYGFSKCARLAVLVALLFNSGCVATQDWVQTFVNEKLFPVEKRISDTEAGMTKMNDRMTGMEGRMDTMSKQIATLDSRLNQTNAKADQALDNLQELQVERKLVLDMKQGSFFPSNSTVLSNQAKQEIDAFFSDVSGQAGGMNGLIVVVTGHTDNAGTEKYNYELARIRAENAATYLASQKKVDPCQLVVMSYGEAAPVADNRTEAGRAKNRRIEILVYRDAVAVGPGGQAAAGR
jgi:outer membrane protein OmpA-like peptidoglycan-associated protein